MTCAGGLIHLPVLCLAEHQGCSTCGIGLHVRNRVFERLSPKNSVVLRPAPHQQQLDSLCPPSAGAARSAGPALSLASDCSYPKSPASMRTSCNRSSPGGKEPPQSQAIGPSSSELNSSIPRSPSQASRRSATASSWSSLSAACSLVAT